MYVNLQYFTKVLFLKLWKFQYSVIVYNMTLVLTLGMYKELKKNNDWYKIRSFEGGATIYWLELQKKTKSIILLRIYAQNWLSRFFHRSDLVSVGSSHENRLYTFLLGIFPLYTYM